MPKRNKSKSKRNKKNQSQGGLHNLTNKGLVIVPKSFPGLPGAVRVTLNYVEAFFTTASSGYLTIRGNDLFDPQAATSGVTGTSNQQPSYFDKWSAMFGRYCVLGSTIDLRVCNNTANGVPTFVEVNPEDQLVTTTNAEQASVARYASSRIYPTGTSTPSFHIRKSMTTAKMNGISEEQVIVSAQYNASVANSPADPWYWQIRFSAVDFTTTPAIIGFVHYEFDVLFTDPLSDDDNDLKFTYEQKRAIREASNDPSTPQNSPIIKNGKDEEFVKVLQTNKVIGKQAQKR